MIEKNGRANRNDLNDEKGNNND